MNQNEKDFLEVCEMLKQLSILKNSEPDEKQIALMAKFLLRELTRKDIGEACSYLSKRKERFPDVADFFNLIAPMQSIDEIAEKEIGGLMSMLKDGWDNSKDKLTEIQKDLLTVWPWHEMARGKDSDLAKTRISMTFYLKNKLGSSGKMKILLSNQAFVKYQAELKQLQGEQNETTTHNLIN